MTVEGQGRASEGASCLCESEARRVSCVLACWGKRKEKREDAEYRRNERPSTSTSFQAPPGRVALALPSQLMRGSDVPTPDGEGRTARSFSVRFRWAAPDDGGRSQDRPTKMTPGGEHIIRNTSDASVPKGQCRNAKDARQKTSDGRKDKGESTCARTWFSPSSTSAALRP